MFSSRLRTLEDFSQVVDGALLAVQRTLEAGAVFGIRGEVIDTRQLLLAIAPQTEEAAARQKAKEIGERFGVDAGVHMEPVARPRGVVEARHPSEHRTVAALVEVEGERAVVGRVLGRYAALSGSLGRGQ